jgi:hypothetical protein
MLCIISLQKALNSRFYGGQIRQLTFPNHAYLPPVSPQTRDVAEVAATIRSEFRQPEAELGFREPRKGATGVGVAMPKAAVDEDDLLLLGENDIRLSRKVRNVEPESVSARTSYFPHQEFRFRILTVDERHSLAALGPRQCVHFLRRAISYFGGWYPTLSRRTTPTAFHLVEKLHHEALDSKINYSLFHRLMFFRR